MLEGSRHPHFSFFIPHSSFLIPHSSFFIPPVSSVAIFAHVLSFASLPMFFSFGSLLTFCPSDLCSCFMLRFFAYVPFLRVVAHVLFLGSLLMFYHSLLCLCSFIYAAADVWNPGNPQGVEGNPLTQKKNNNPFFSFRRVLTIRICWNPDSLESEFVGFRLHWNRVRQRPSSPGRIRSSMQQQQ